MSDSDSDGRSNAADVDQLLRLIEGLSERGVVPRSVTVGSVTVDVSATDWVLKPGSSKKDAPRPGTPEWYREQKLSALTPPQGGER